MKPVWRRWKAVPCLASLLLLAGLFASPAAAQPPVPPFPPELPPLLDPLRALQLLNHGTPVDDAPLDASGDVHLLILWSAAAAAGRDVWTASLGYVAENNQAFLNSQITSGRHVLVGTAVVPYVEGVDQGLSWLTLAGGIPYSQLLRNLFQADCVALVTRDQACGRAYILASSSFCLAHTERSCADSNLTYAHEVGHTGGAHHNRPDAGCGTTCTGDAYGWAWPGGRTIMAYPGAGPKQSPPVTDGPRLPFFSNPAVLHAGFATGVLGSANNAAMLQARLPVMAGFKPGLSEKPVPSMPSLIGLARP